MNRPHDIPLPLPSTTLFHTHAPCRPPLLLPSSLSSASHPAFCWVEIRVNAAAALRADSRRWAAFIKRDDEMDSTKQASDNSLSVHDQAPSVYSFFDGSVLAARCGSAVIRFQQPPPDTLLPSRQRQRQTSLKKCSLGRMNDVQEINVPLSWATYASHRIMSFSQKEQEK